VPAAPGLGRGHLPSVVPVPAAGTVAVPVSLPAFAVLVPAAAVGTVTVFVVEDPHAASVRSAAMTGSRVAGSFMLLATLVQRLTPPKQGLT
jgi:hypothetical protein